MPAKIHPLRAIRLKQRPLMSLARLAKVTGLWESDLSRFENFERTRRVPLPEQAKILAQVFYPEQGSPQNRKFRLQLLYPDEL